MDPLTQHLASLAAAMNRAILEQVPPEQRAKTAWPVGCRPDGIVARVPYPDDDERDYEDQRAYESDYYGGYE